MFENINKVFFFILYFNEYKGIPSNIFNACYLTVEI